MRVMLMEPFPETAVDNITPTPPIEVGNTYDAIDEYHTNGRVYYILAEYGPDYGWRTTFFATLPDQTADEMAEAEHEAIANLETVPA